MWLAFSQAFSKFLTFLVSHRTGIELQHIAAEDRVHRDEGHLLYVSSMIILVIFLVLYFLPAYTMLNRHVGICLPSYVDLVCQSNDETLIVLPNLCLQPRRLP